jgi:4a-hydroxytetrahydrobiopterin dehydratase
VTAAAPPGWEMVDGPKLRREFHFDDFVEAFGFMTRCALVAERMDHHPNWSNVYSTVIVELWSHDVGGVSDRDVQLAEEMSRLARGSRETTGE